MSAIAGVLLFDESLNADGLIQSITSYMGNYGEDKFAHWSSGSIALGHRMLAATPEARDDRQPHVDSQRGLSIVMDGRLDNREDLYRRLMPRFAQQGTPDVFYLLEAYQRWGEACPSRLIGDFAFAIWDEKKRSLFCARDSMGGGGLYFVKNRSLFAFASDPESLLNLPGVSKKPNEDNIASMLVPEFSNANDRRTWQHDVIALLAGEYMTVEKAGLMNTVDYGRLRPASLPSFNSDEECIESFRSVFSEAIRCRLRRKGDISVMLSGGLDTAAIVGTLREILRGEPSGAFNSYSVIDDDVERSLETRAILNMAELPGVSSNFVSAPSITGMVGLEDLTELAWGKAHPVDNSVLLPALMCKSASRKGARVMLNGASGDITLRSSRSYAARYLRQGKFSSAWEECRQASENHVYLRGASPGSIFLRNVYAAFVPSSIKALVNRGRRRWRSGAPDFTIINPDFAADLKLRERLEAQYLEYARVGDENDIDHRSDVTRKIIMSVQSANRRISSRFGMEIRDPWADRRVVEFFLGLPEQYLVRDGWTKYLVRIAFRDELASEVLWRRDKEHLGPRIISRLMLESKDLIDHLFYNQMSEIDRYVDTKSVHALYKQYRRRPQGQTLDIIYELIVLILWLHRVNRI